MTFCLFSWTCCFEIHSVTIRSGSCRTYCRTWWYFVFYLNHWGPQQPVKNQDTSSLFEREGWLDQCAVKNDISTTVSFSSLSPFVSCVPLRVTMWRPLLSTDRLTIKNLPSFIPLSSSISFYRLLNLNSFLPSIPPSHALHASSLPFYFCFLHLRFLSLPPPLPLPLYIFPCYTEPVCLFHPHHQPSVIWSVKLMALFPSYRHGDESCR